MNRTSQQSDGSTLIAAVVTIAVGALIIGSFYQTLIPKYRSIHQSASWHDALQGAEAGANYTLDQLNQFALSSKNSDDYNWEGKQWTFTDATFHNKAYRPNGERTLADASLPVLGGQNNVVVTRLAVDVYTRGKAAPNHPWFRIRSTASADIAGRFVSADKRDIALRRMKLGNKKAGKDAPSVSRTIEVIAKPRFRFSKAIVTETDLSLGNSANWGVDSFDSTDSNKSDPGTSAGGVYPSNASKRQSNGNIASKEPLPDGTLYGALIDGNGATVAGDVHTSGGDNPATTTHENVSGSGGMDQNRIFDDFDEDLTPVSRPTWSPSAPLPKNGDPFSTGTAESPARYVVSGSLGAFTVKGPADKKDTGYVEIIVDGNLDIGNGNKASIVIPENVYATIYVNGNIDFGNGDVNSGKDSSNVATRLTVFGVSTAANPTYTASGNAVQILSFYGPNYGITLNGTVTTIGAMAGKSFKISGGGNGGFHYDEALGKGGDIVGWEPASYFEDSRTDL